MADEHPVRTEKGVTESDLQPMEGCLVRLGWLIVAPLVLALLGMSVARSASGPWIWESVAYFVVVAGAVAIRYVDILWLRGDTASGEPATRKDGHRYALTLSAVALALWGVAVWLG